MTRSLRIVCFAVKEEARFFKPAVNYKWETLTLVTGMGARNAENALRGAMEKRKPALVLTCGFAGALKPELMRGTIVFNVDPETNLDQKLLTCGAVRTSFHCAPKVATTAEEKRVLRQSTSADVVEMESRVICDTCRNFKIPSGTVRVILDTADEDLPLDFNELMTANQHLNPGKLALALLKAPWKIPALIRLQSQSAAAAKKLALVLNDALLEDTVVNALEMG